MLDLFDIAKPQNCDVQVFYGGGDSLYNLNYRTWSKPRGVSHVYMLLIGGGGAGNGGSIGGGSGAVTVWYGAAMHVPDILYVQPGGIAGSSLVFVKTGSTTYHSLANANGASGTNGGSADSGNLSFYKTGFFASAAGENGSSSSVSPSVGTFLSGGADASTDRVTQNYGYNAPSSNANGYFLLSPIPVSVGGNGAGRGGIGSGGGRSGTGSPGMILIASW
jgi:hypothetical protein